MKKSEEEYKAYFDVLELPPGVSFAEVMAAYYHLRELYSTDSIVLSPLEGEISRQWKNGVLGQIEEAYGKLKAFYEEAPHMVRALLPAPPPAKEAVVEAPSFEVKEYSGETLMRLRERRGIDIHELAHATKISRQHLRNIEDEKFSALPEKVFLRGYLASYARCLSLDPEKVTSDYMDRYEGWKRKAAADGGPPLA